MSDIVIQVDNVTKAYRLGTITSRTLKEDVARWLARLRGQPDPNLKLGQEHADRKAGAMFWALRGVSFEVKRGEVLGIIGPNGAGKSTLLKILSQITSPTEGEIRILGRVASLLEVGTGFHPELTGRQNVFLNGAILGMTSSEVRSKYDEIVEFAEIGEFMDTPVKRYSSGMYVRLAFAVAAHLEPEVLILDEVLSVGDAAFQKKCLGKMQSVVGEGRTVIFVSHSMPSVRSLCQKCVWVDAGQIRQFGKTGEVVQEYLHSYDRSDRSGEKAECSFPEDVEKEFQLRAGKLVDATGRMADKFECDYPITIELLCQAHTGISGLYGYLSINKQDGTEILVSDSCDVVPNPLDVLSPGYYIMRIRLPARTLGPGDYGVYLSFACPSTRLYDVDVPGTILTFHLDDSTSRRGNNRGGHFSTLLPWDVHRSADRI